MRGVNVAVNGTVADWSFCRTCSSPTSAIHQPGGPVAVISLGFKGEREQELHRSARGANETLE